MLTKICSQCGAEKVVDDFPFENKELGIWRANCKDCKNEASKKYYASTRDEPESVARRIVNKCKEREKYRLAKFIQRRDFLNHLPEVELTPNEFDIDYNWVLEQRDKQNNKCYYTDTEMVWSTGLIDMNKRINPYAITIERIDSLGTYVRANCVLCCWWANCAKNAGTIDELVHFSFEVVRKYINENNLKVWSK